ncbi:NAD(P)-dependent malic enzyme [Turicibacter sanguinis]|uniref:NAD(P)-dependent malic enzyme n=1 Tax=Turicibacter sanguinis TaxID=154288 RepID=UPI0018A9C602|nr:malic enzyme-like NAD(P)-binding protein [Turicibacter sanguinis]
MNVFEKSLALHESARGKIEINSKVKVETKEDLSLAYSPGVAEPCREIAKNEDEIYKYTSKGNMVAVITDGSAVLGLGNIGPKAALPVMEGKSILLKQFANVDSFPLCLDTQDVELIIKTCKLLAPSLGGINLEDISAPRCVEIERRLIEEMDIPVFHDDQHGTAIVVSAALINACKLTNKELSSLKVIVSGTGAAGSSIIKMLHALGVKNIIGYNIDGIVHKSKADRYDFLTKELLEITNPEDFIGDDTLASALVGADVFIGVSVANIVTKEMIAKMNKDPFIFAMANPNPEIMPDLAKEGGALVVGTGRSDFPNQINNVLAFPGIFRGALDARAKKINEEMKMAAAIAIASCVSDDELAPDFIIPSPFNPDVAKKVAEAVKETAKKTNVARI